MADLIYIYVGTAERQMLIHPEWQADADFDPRVRPWYQLASQHVGKMVWTEPYYDYTNGTLVIALARAITDKEGKVRGSSRWMPSWPLLRPAEPAVEQRLPDDRQPVGQGAGPPRSPHNCSSP